MNKHLNLPVIWDAMMPCDGTVIDYRKDAV